MLAAKLLHLADSLGSGAAGGQHGVDDEHVTVGHVLGHLAEVGMGLQRLLVAVHTDVADAGGGDHTQHAVHQTQTGTEDGNHHKLAARQRGRVHLADRGLDVLGGQGQVTGSLIGDEHSDLGYQLAEIFDAGVLVAHDGQLVGHQRVVHDMNFLAVHFVSSVYVKFCVEYDRMRECVLSPA